MEKKLPIYKMSINDNDESGVSYVALVDEPAIERNWLAFNKLKLVVEPESGESKDDFLNRCIPIEINAGHEQEQAVAICSTKYDSKFSNHKFKFKADKERRIITGALMIADLPIYRFSEKMGEFYVVFDKPTIEKIAQKFFKNGNTANVNKMHQADEVVDGVYMFESFIVDSERGILPPKGFDGISDGSWIGSYKVDNDDVWNNFIKTGELKAFSVEGLFDMDKEKESIDKEILKVIDEISKL